jgi:hypothetical protein
VKSQSPSWNSCWIIINTNQVCYCSNIPHLYLLELTCLVIILQHVDRYWIMVANKHVSTATNQHATIEELLETVFSTAVHAKSHKRDEVETQWSCGICARQ